MDNSEVNKLIDKYYPDNNELKHILVEHSSQVAQRALQVAEKHPELNLDCSLLYAGGMLHDIGIFKTHAPDIYCMGSDPYIMHGSIGARLLRNEGQESLARICERHTGVGLSREDFRELHLPQPEQDLFPETVEEKVICYADKFYSKSNLNQVKTPEQAYHSLQKFGEDGAQRFWEWHKMFG